jgi:hypothetical protein
MRTDFNDFVASNKIEEITIDSSDPIEIKRQIDELIANKLKSGTDKIVVTFKNGDVRIGDKVTAIKKDNFYDEVNEKGFVGAISDILAKHGLVQDIAFVDKTFTKEMKEIISKNLALEQFIENRFGVKPVYKQERTINTLSTATENEGILDVYKKDVVKVKAKRKKVKNEKRTKEPKKKHAVHKRIN